jgi:hypothetical protein
MVKQRSACLGSLARENRRARIRFHSVGDGSKVEKRDGSKVNWQYSEGKMAEYVGPDEIGGFFKDPEF